MARERQPHIGIFGRRNNGKSTLINLLTGQELAIVSSVAGTTTDPVRKSVEILGFAPAILIDTAGIDDVGTLGKKRIAKTKQVVKTIDLAILVITNNCVDTFEIELIKKFKQFDVPFIVVHNKQDIETLQSVTTKRLKSLGAIEVLPFGFNNVDLNPLVKAIKIAVPNTAYTFPSLLGDIISKDDIVLLITPIDSEAPEGRMILPQVQAIRDVLDNSAVCIVLKENAVTNFLAKTSITPNLVVTDSQVFKKVDAIIPKHVPLTGFSVMLAKFKGNFDAYLKGTPKIDELKNGDKVLLLESCTHHTTCDDIGRVKIPRWLTTFTGKQLEFTVVAGLAEIPNKITDYALIIQCGGCMITPKQISGRLQPAIEAGVSVTNYGMTIAYVQGIYQRAIAPFVIKK